MGSLCGWVMIKFIRNIAKRILAAEMHRLRALEIENTTMQNRIDYLNGRNKRQSKEIARLILLQSEPKQPTKRYQSKKRKGKHK